MQLGLRREEAIFIRDLIIFERAEFGEARLKQVYGDIDIEGLLKQLDNIIMLAESVEEEKKIVRIFGLDKAEE